MKSLLGFSFAQVLPNLFISDVFVILFSFGVISKLQIYVPLGKDQQYFVLHSH